MKKPQALQSQIEKIIQQHGIDRKKFPFVMVGIRGYYLDTMGLKAKNDRGIYDDAIFIISPTAFMAVNGNTDPSRIRKGKGRGSSKGMASLNTGVWFHKTGMHNGSSPHMAFRQAEPVVVTRDGLDGDYQDEGMFGINIHRGGKNGTSSLGCQTIIPSQWEAFKALGYSELKKYKQAKFPYILVLEERLNAKQGTV